jgi:hypothetical protein
MAGSVDKSAAGLSSAVVDVTVNLGKKNMTLQVKPEEVRLYKSANDLFGRLRKMYSGRLDENGEKYDEETQMGMVAYWLAMEVVKLRDANNESALAEAAEQGIADIESVLEGEE